ncbi:MAG TPA: hypothetical protein VGO67_09580 [Verrucomicrobiae bacterium]|jgi:hypothetical protein
MRNKVLTLPASARWGSALTTAFVAAAATYSWWHGVSPWLGFTIALVAGTATDMIWAAREIVPLPHIALLIASLQYGLAPWASNFYPSLYAEYQINDLPEYFDYAGPVLAAMTLGFLLSGMGLRLKHSDSERQYLNPGLLRELDFLLWGGVVFSLFFSHAQGSLAFVMVLLGCLRYIGAIGWMIVAAPGWKWRVGVLLLFEIYNASSSGMFHDLILWSLSLLAIYVFLRHVKRLVFVSALVGLVAAIFFLQDAKWTLRDAIWNESNEIVLFGKPMTFSPWTRPFVSAFCLVDSCTKFFSGGYSEESIANSVTRFNQGWIIDRVMHHMPSEEPFARGETIWGALRAAALPRFLAPDKLVVNGRVNMERFAGHDMVGDTTMNIGFGGEMYANFGLWGGVIGCGCYALVLGLFFRWAAVLAQKSPFWWAIAVFCGHWAFKAETDIGGVLNYVVKSVILVFFVTLLMPALRNELLGKSTEAGRSTDDPRGSRRQIRGRKSGFRSPHPDMEPVPATVPMEQHRISPIPNQIKNADA